MFHVTRWIYLAALVFTTDEAVPTSRVINRALLEQPDSLWTDMQLALRREEP